MSKFICVICFLIMIAAPVFCQQPHGLLSLELLGKGAYVSLTYEQYLTENLSLGTGIGTPLFSRGDLSRTVNYQTENEYNEDGTYFDVMMYPPLYISYSFGSDTHRLLATLGVTFSISFSSNLYPSGRENSFEIQPIPFFGAGYEYRGDEWFGRIVPYVAYLGEDSGWFPNFMPWIGAAVGKTVDY
ncbi:MAG: hypothetical protein JEY99_12405 [Spirochaetales bacterium]|nr:hypothetical protein [Spirochaetales bacterium]